MVKPRVSVQVLNYNGKRFLKDCFDSLLKQDYSNFEIVFVDNGSIDGSVEFMEKEYGTQIKNKKIKIIHLKKNYGFAEGNNIPYRKTKADYVLLLNNDVIIPKKNFVSSLINSAKKYNAEIVSGLECPIGKIKKSKKGEKNKTLGILGFNAEDVIKEKETFYVAGCLLINKKKVDYLFLKEYFAYGEDVFLCWRARLKGYKVILDEKAVYLHYGAGTKGKRSPFVRCYAEKNRLTNLLIFYQLTTLFKLFPLYSFEFLIKLTYSIRYPKLFLAPFSALLWNIFHPYFIIKNRNLIQKERKVKDKELMKLMSYKIFPEHIAPSLAKRLNAISKYYCKLFRIKTYDL